MSADIKAWPLQGPITQDQPEPIKRPCDYGLEGAIWGLETQLGTIEAYNRLAAAAHRLKSRIDDGDIRPQNQIFAKDIRGKI